MRGSDSGGVLNESLGPYTLEERSVVPDAYHSGSIFKAAECLKAWWDSGIIK
jgi:hypothetical protein